MQVDVAKVNCRSVDKENGVMGSPEMKLCKEVSWIIATEHAGTRNQESHP